MNPHIWPFRVEVRYFRAEQHKPEGPGPGGRSWDSDKQRQEFLPGKLNAAFRRSAEQVNPGQLPVGNALPSLETLKLLSTLGAGNGGP